jgi:hypothetical protein
MSSPTLMTPAKTKLAAATFLPLSQENWKPYLEHISENVEEYEPYELAGCIGMRGDLLGKALKITTTFQSVCKSVFDEIQTNAGLKQDLFRAFRNLPTVRASMEAAPFFMEYMRMDFFLDLENEALQIVEVNSSGAGLTDYLPCIDFLQKLYSFKTPEGSKSLKIDDVPSRLINYCKKQKPDLRTLGLVAMENGCNDYIVENGAYGKWLREHTDITPVFLALDEGKISILDHPDLPNDITDLSAVDAVLVDFFEDLECLEKVQKQLDELGALLVPPRSDLLFENKHFLSILQTIKKPQSISADDWNLLQDALLPSFPLEDYEEYRELMREWDGVVLKMDIDCCGENVHLFDFSKISFEDAMRTLEIKKKESQKAGITYTLQKMVHPPHIPLAEPTPKWIGMDYAPYKFDVMTYTCFCDDVPHVLFGSRCFSREKVDELTEEGREDALGSPICTL